MAPIMLIGFVAVIVWSLVAHRFERVGVAGPAALVVLGALAVLIDVPAFEAAIDDDATEHIVEVILAILLFVDACEVTGGVFGRVGRLLSRLVLIALPLSLVLAVLLGQLLVPGVSVFVLVVLACVVMPTDFAPAAGLLRAKFIPARVRQILNVESGYNDGLISPIFGMSIALALAWPAIERDFATVDGTVVLDDEHVEQTYGPLLEAFFGAVPATVWAIVVGLVVGGLLGLLVRWTSSRGYSNASGIRYVALLAPLLTYGIATLHSIDANGFVAAFVAGVMYRFMRVRGTEEKAIPHAELLLAEEVGTLAANFVWFVLGGAAMAVIVGGIEWSLLLFAVAALTLLRIVPVWIAMLGSRTTWAERTVMGVVGPRGTASIVFGLLAYNKLNEDDGNLVLTVTVLTVVGSILLHGVAAPLLLRRRPLPDADDASAAPASVPDVAR